DITAEKAAAEKLRVLNHDFVTLLENTSDFIYFKDKDSRIRFCSQAMAALCGYASWRDMLGKHDREIFPGELAQIYEAEERPVFLEGKPLLNKIDPYLDRQGNRRWVSNSKWPVFDDDHRTVVGIFGISRDVTEHRNAERELEREALRNETLLRAANDGIHVLDANGNVLEANEVFCRMLGYTHDEALKLNVAQWDVKWSAEELTGQVMPGLLKEQTVFETRHRRSDGRIIDVEVSAAGVEIDGQSLLFAASRDITARKQLENAVRMREEKLERIFVGAPVGIAVLTDRVITVANDRFCETVGYSRDEVLGMSTRAFYLSEEDYYQTGNRFYLDSGEKLGQLAEARFRRKDGRIIDVLLTMAAMHHDDPKAEATFMVMDITERKRAELELARYADELAEANKLKDIFTDILRHDILNPVTAIKVATELMARRAVDTEYAEILNSIKRSVSNLTEMTENAAKLARLAATDDMEIEKLDLATMLSDVLQDFDSQLQEKDVSVELAVPQAAAAELSPVVKEVFANLLSNAIKYGPAHGKIELRLREEDESWLVSVTDQGGGISDENKERVFHRFERIGKQGVKGTGLGLAIAQRLVSMHRGRIWVEDNPQGGCVFLVRLPKRALRQTAASGNA
ncbi:MAG TPA: PAS domain-containing sensor histidine kinase, partial [Polyangiales bacterium]